MADTTSKSCPGPDVPGAGHRCAHGFAVAHDFAVPSPVAVALMRSFADRVSMDARAHAGNLAASLNKVIDCLRAADLIGAMGAMVEIERSSLRFNAAFNAPATATMDSIKALDPAFYSAISPAVAELRAQKTADTLMDIPTKLLRDAAAAHGRECREVGCRAHRAFEIELGRRS